jgi:hypothetical protein
MLSLNQISFLIKSEQKNCTYHEKGSPIRGQFHKTFFNIICSPRGNLCQDLQKHADTGINYAQKSFMKLAIGGNMGFRYVLQPFSTKRLKTQQALKTEKSTDLESSNFYRFFFGYAGPRPRPRT